jgi:hypothetical protein
VRTKAVLATVAVVSLAALLLAVNNPSSPPAASSRLPGEYYGINGQALRLMAGDGRLRLLKRQLGQLQRLHVSFVRANLDWLQLEPNPPVDWRHAYDFSTHDDWVRALARHGLRWYVVGVGTPEWAADPGAIAAGCGIFSPPADPSTFAALMRAIASRYGRDGSFWAAHPRLPYRPAVDYEVWNEPNLGGAWCPGPDPTAYAGLLQSTAAAIREVDPQADIVFGGLAPVLASAGATPTSRPLVAADGFLSDVLAADPGSRDAIDTVGVHAYGDPAAVFQQVAWYRSALDAVGLSDVPLSLNETGWTTSGSGGFVPVGEAERASYLGEVARGVASSDCGVTSFAPHTWVTDETDPADQEDWFGIANPRTGKPYPSARAYAAAIRALPSGRVVPGGAIAPNCGG